MKRNNLKGVRKHPESETLIKITPLMHLMFLKMAHQFGVFPVEALTQQQVKFIMMLHVGGSRKLTELSRMSSVTKGTISTGIQRLLSKKLVIKKQDTIDKRVFYLSLSPKGEGIVQKIEEGIKAMFDVLLDELSPDERTQFVEAHELIIRTYHKAQMRKDLPQAHDLMNEDL